MDKPEHLIKGSKVALRLWDEKDVHDKAPVTRDYETAGYVLEGTATLDLNGEQQQLRKGDSYLVPAGVKHTYDISGHFRCIEATSV